MSAEVNAELCQGCGRCTEVCVASAIIIKEGKAEVIQGECCHCFSCADECPYEAMEFRV